MTNAAIQISADNVTSTFLGIYVGVGLLARLVTVF